MRQQKMKLGNKSINILDRMNTIKLIGVEALHSETHNFHFEINRDVLIKLNNFSKLCESMVC